MTDNHHVQANIEVENESVKQLIMTNVETLKQSITQSGIQLGGFSVSLNNPEGKMKREYEQKKKEQGGQQNMKVDKVVTEEIKEKKLGYNTYEYLA
jgi:flagellar hook-length control protein FliK